MSNKEKFESGEFNVSKPENIPPNSDDVDMKFKELERRHRRTKHIMDSYFQNLIHPLILVGASALYFILFLIIKYWSISSKSPVIQAMNEDLHNASGYIATAVISCIVTEFIQNLRNHDKKISDLVGNLFRIHIQSDLSIR